MAVKGGTQKPDYKARTAGPGALSKRTDMSQPVRVPNMAGSDLQYGEKQALAGAQKIQPLGRQQNPQSRGGAPQQAGGAAQPQPASGIPGAPSDPLAFLTRRLSGTLTQTPTQRGPMGRPGFDGARWLPLLRAIATDPGSGGLLQTAYLNALSTAVNSPSTPITEVVDFNLLDGTILDENA